MDENHDFQIQVGCRVRIRTVGTRAGSDEHVVALVPHGDGGRHRLTPLTPLHRALLGRRPGDVVDVATAARTVQFEVMAVQTGQAQSARAAGVAEPGMTAQDLTTGPQVRVGDIVDVQDGELREWWRVVPHGEADALRHWISAESPLGRAVLGHRAGDIVQVRSPQSWEAGRPVAILAVQPTRVSE